MPRWPKKLDMNVDSVSTDKPPKVTRKPRMHKVTLDMVDAIVQMMTLPLNFIAPEYALTVVESDALVVAMTDLAAQNPWVANIVYSLVTGSQLLEVPLVVGAIGVNKLVVAKRLPDTVKIGTDVLLESVAARRVEGRVHGKQSAGRRDGSREEGSESKSKGIQSVRPEMESHGVGESAPQGQVQGQL